MTREKIKFVLTRKETFALLRALWFYYLFIFGDKLDGCLLSALGLLDRAQLHRPCVRLIQYCNKTNYNLTPGA